MKDRYRYKILQEEEYTLLLRDDGYRIWFKVLWDRDATNPEPTHDWELWAEYKQCDRPDVGELIANMVMGDAK